MEIDFISIFKTLVQYWFFGLFFFLGVIIKHLREVLQEFRSSISDLHDRVLTLEVTNNLRGIK